MTAPHGEVLAEGDVQVALVPADATPGDIDPAYGDLLLIVDPGDNARAADSRRTTDGARATEGAQASGGSRTGERTETAVLVDQDSEVASMVVEGVEAAPTVAEGVITNAIPVVAKADVLRDGTFEIGDLERGHYKLVYLSDTIAGLPLWYRGCDGVRGCGDARPW